MSAPADTLTCANSTEWESWLAAHHAQSPGIWLLIAKKGSTKAANTP